MAYRAPAAPASTAEVTKARSLYLVAPMPTLSAAMRLSRSAMMARPERLLIRLSTTVRAMSTRIKPAVKEESFTLVVTPMGPFRMALPPSPRASAASFWVEKWSPLPSMPT